MSLGSHPMSDDEDLHEAARCLQSSLQYYPDQKRILARLSIFLSGQYAVAGGYEFLDVAIDFVTKAAEGAHTDQPPLHTMLYNLGSKFAVLFQQHGGRDNLLSSIRLTKSAIAVIPKGEQIPPQMSDNLASSLATAVFENQDDKYLNQALETAEQTEKASSGNEITKGQILGLQGTILATRYTMKGKPEDLNEAISKTKQAVKLAPEDLPNFSN